GLEQALALGASDVTVTTDSELMANQIRGRYKIKSPHLRQLSAQAQDIIRQFQSFKIDAVRRDLNQEADMLASAAAASGRDVVPEEAAEIVARHNSRSKAKVAPTSG